MLAQDLEVGLLCLDTFLDRLQFADAVFQRIGSLVDALDAFKAAAQLQLMLAHLRFHWSNHGLEPVLNITIGNLINMYHPAGQRLEKLRGQGDRKRVVSGKSVTERYRHGG